MNAHQQLAELNSHPGKVSAGSSLITDLSRYCELATAFARENGQLVADLITSFAEEEQARESIRQYEFNECSRPNGYDEGHATSLRESLTAIKRKRQRILATLTEPK